MPEGQGAGQAQSVAVPHRLPLIIHPDNRDATTTKDAQLINCYVEVTDQETKEYDIFKRPGTVLNSTVAASQAGAGTWNWLGDVYTVFNNTLYKNGTSLGTVDNTGGLYRFGQTLGATPRLVLGNGVKGYTWDGTTLAAITTGGASAFPTAFVKGWAYLDGTLYVADTANNIIGSNINDPTNWPSASANTIAAQVESDKNRFLWKQLVYVVDFKQWSTEFFYDAGNATGSPLGPVQGAKVNYGAVSGESVQDIDGVLIWMAQGKDGNPIFMLLDNAKPTQISTKPIERLILGVTNSNTIYSWQAQIGGHKFYVCTIVSLNITLVYDLSDKRWHRWADSNGNYMPYVSSTTDSSGNIILQHATNGNLYNFSTTTYTDAGTVFNADIYTPNFDGNNRRSKQLNYLEIVGDKTNGSFFLVRHNDNDYDPNSWTQYRRVEMWTRRSLLMREGSFRRRAYHFRHGCNTPMRIASVDLQLDIGTL